MENRSTFDTVILENKWWQFFLGGDSDKTRWSVYTSTVNNAVIWRAVRYDRAAYDCCIHPARPQCPCQS